MKVVVLVLWAVVPVLVGVVIGRALGPVVHVPPACEWTTVQHLEEVSRG